MHILYIKENSDLLVIEKDNKIIEKIPEIYHWKENNFKLLGYNKEKKNNENKYELPPPIDINLYFGELFICKVDNNNKLINIQLEDFQSFYNTQFGGFYDISYSSNEEEDTLSEHSSDNDFINDNTISNYSSDSNISLDLNDSDVSDVSIDITSEEDNDENEQFDNIFSDDEVNDKDDDEVNDEVNDKDDDEVNDKDDDEVNDEVNDKDDDEVNDEIDD